MTHLLVSRHFPPAPGGGIGTYLGFITKLLVEHGETVHVIARQHPPATAPLEELHGGHLVVHRLPVAEGGFNSIFGGQRRAIPNELQRIGSSSLRFAWDASRYAEDLIASVPIDVIEVQDYQAPLYFLQLRRALGLGPRRQPPLLVHLHSPTEMIVEEEDVDLDLAHVELARRMERFSIAAADSLLAPSDYQARAVTALMDPSADIEVIPLPIDGFSVTERAPATWSNGSICFLGRLEPRKGIIEWLEAIAEVVAENNEARFDFIGRDDRSTAAGVPMREHILNRLPAALHSRIRFYGDQPRPRLPDLLAGARAVVVPSRWESFSYTCAEALSAGLPVIATPVGAMPEMVIQGRTGWLASAPTAIALATSLREALATTPERLAAMGAEAAVHVRQFCASDEVLERHMKLRQHLTRHGPLRSVHLPKNLNWLTSRATPQPPQTAREEDSGRRVGVVIDARRSSRVGPEIRRFIADATRAGIPLIEMRKESRGEPIDLQMLSTRFNSKPPPLGLLVLAAADAPAPGLIEACEAIFTRNPEVGIVTYWHTRGNVLDFELPPIFPTQWVRNEVLPGACFRWEALGDLPENQFLYDEYYLWCLANHVMVNGWLAVTVPEVLNTSRSSGAMKWTDSPADAYQRRRLLNPHLDRVAQDLPEVLTMAHSHSELAAINGGASGRLLSIARSAAYYVARRWRDG